MFGRFLSRCAVVAPLVAIGVACLATPAAASSTPRWFVNAGAYTTGETKPITLMGELTLESNAVGEVFCRNVMEGSVINEAVTEGGTKPRGELEGWGTNACRAPRLEEYFKAIFGQEITVFATAELPIIREFTEASVCELEYYEAGKKGLEQCPAESEREVRELPTLLGLHRRTSSFPWKMEAVPSEREESGENIDRIGIAAGGKTCYPREVITIHKGKPEQTEVEGASPWQNVPEGCIKLDVIAPQIPDEVVFYGTLEPKIVNGVKNGLSPSRLNFSPKAGQLVSGEPEIVVPETTSQGELKFFGTEGLELVTVR